MTPRRELPRTSGGDEREVPLASGRPLSELWLQVGPALLVLLVLAVASGQAGGVESSWFLIGLVVAALLSGLGLTAAIGRLRRNSQEVHRRRAEVEERCERLLRETTDGLLALDLMGRIVACDSQTAMLFGYTAEELSSLSLPDLIEQSDTERSRPARPPEFGSKINASGLTKQGTKLNLQLASVPPLVADGSQVWLLVWDRTECAEAKRKLARLEFIAEESPHPIVEADRSGHVRFMNVAAKQQFPELATGGGAHPLLQQLPALVERLQRGRQSSFLREVIVGPRLFEQHITYVPSNDSVRIFSFDVSDRREALRDTLTGLPNRASFRRRLNRVAALAKGDTGYTFAVLFLDLDRFKILNDTMGHTTGDRMLQSVAERLEACLRPSDMVARIGGDEFTILLDGIRDQNEAEVITRRILERLHHGFELEPQTLFTSASVGIALNTVGYDDPLDLVEFADAAMYRAKTEGRARFTVFDPVLDGHAVARRLF